MTLNTYASQRSTPTGITFTTASGGNLTGGTTLYFFAQTRNRVGLSLHSASTTLTPAAGEKVVCTIGASAIATGEDIREIWISASTTNDATTAKLIGIWRSRNPLTLDGTDYPGEGTAKSLPATVEFSRDAHLTISGSVASSAALPSGTNLKNGMLREVANIAEVWRWDEEATDGELASGTGYWIQHTRGFTVGDSFSTYYGTSTQLLGGCDRPLADLSGEEYILEPPPYNPDGLEQDVPLVLWVSNGDSADGGAILSTGTKLGVQIRIDGENRSVAFAGKVIARLLGYVDRATGVLDTAIATVGVDIVLTSSTTDETPRLTGIEIPEDMARGEAAAYAIAVQFLAGEIPGITEGSSATVVIYPSGELGTYNPALGAVTGDLIFPEGDRLRIVPSPSGFRRLSGSGIIKDYTTPAGLGMSDFAGLTADTASQKITISGALGGFCRRRAPGGSLLDSEALRALVGTESGEYTASSYTGSLVVASDNVKGLQITVGYPCDANGNGTIRANYPDTAIASNALGYFNPPKLRVYVNNGTTITRLTQEITVLPGVSQVFTITDLSGTTVGALPDSSGDPDFGLFGYSSIGGSVVATASSIPTGSYTVAIAYYYPSPNTAITTISHDPGNGCIDELNSTLTEAASIADYWGNPVADVGSLPGGENIGKNRLVQDDGNGKARLATYLSPWKIWQWALLDEIGVFTVPQAYEVQAIAISAGAITLDCSTSGVFAVTLTANINTINISNIQPGASYRLIFKQDGTGGRTVTGWGSEFKFVNGLLPIIDIQANGYTIVELFSPDGSDILTTVVGGYY